MVKLPTIKEELTRKALDQLERLVTERSHGIITEAQYATGIDVLWEVVSGLVDRDFFDMISMTSVSRNDPSFRRTRMFAKYDEYMIFSLHPDAKIMVKTNAQPDWKLFFEGEHLLESVKRFEALSKNLEQKGFSVITLTT